MVSSSLVMSFLALFLLFAYIVQATVPSSNTFNYQVKPRVPSSNTFKLVHSGLIYGYVEDGAAYYTDVEEASNQRFEKLGTYPFNLCFFASSPEYNENTSDFTLALRLQERLVWIAKQTKPVGINATLTFGRDGNLILADENGKIVWQTGTSNIGVVDIKLLPDGNMVLLDSQGGFVWQTFDYPTDVLLAGQSIRASGVNKLVSRTSPVNPTPGPYSLVLKGTTVAFYYTSTDSDSKPAIYSKMDSIYFARIVPLAEMKFGSNPATSELSLYEQSLSFIDVNNSSPVTVIPIGAQPNFNATYSYLQLGGDGNLRFHTYLDFINDKTSRTIWMETYTEFSRGQYKESECKLPERCGALGVCEDNQCVACPSPKGLRGWSKRCVPIKLPSCNSAPGTNVSYHRVVGVDHFSSDYAGKTMKQVDCRKKCSEDCKCKGYFYRKAESKCLITPILNTLTRVSNANHLAFIKIST